MTEPKQNPTISTPLIATETERHEHENTITIDIAENSEANTWSNCCIQRVPRKLRQVNDKAYTPQLVSVGPFHHGRSELLPMEPHKRRYYEEFQRRTGRSHGDLSEFAHQRSADIFGSYAGMAGEAAIDIVVVDSCFILELFLRNSEGRHCEDYILRTPCLRRDVELDLILLENQLPFAFLYHLYRFSVAPLLPSRPSCSGIDTRGETENNSCRLSKLALEFFSHARHLEAKEAEGVLHFTDLVRRALCPAEPLPSGGHVLLHSARRLQASGLIFAAAAENHRVADVALVEGWFTCSPRLRMAQLRVEDDTECILRNVMALEQCVYPYEAHLCNYILFLDKLVDTSEDVDLLVDRRVVRNLLGSSEVVAKLINGLCDQIVVTSSCYSDIAERLNRYCDSWVNSTRATIKNVYFKDCWTASTTVFGFCVLIFSISATIKALFS